MRKKLKFLRGFLFHKIFKFSNLFQKYFLTLKNLFFAPQKLFDIMPNRRNIKIFNTGLVKTGNCIDKKSCRQKTQNFQSAEQVNRLIYLKTDFIFVISTNDYPRKRDFIQIPDMMMLNRPPGGSICAGMPLFPVPLLCAKYAAMYLL